jgi:hypothetical protein
MMANNTNQKLIDLREKFVSQLLSLINRKKLEDMPMDYSFSILSKLKKSLPKNTPTRVFPHLSQSARTTYIREKINFLETITMQLLYHKEFVDGLKWEDELGVFPEVSNENIFRSVYDQLSVSARRLTEALIELKGFSQNDDENSYKIFYCVLEIDNLEKTQSDLAEYYGAYSLSRERMISGFQEDFHNIFQESGEKLLFFLKGGIKPKFASFKVMWKKVSPFLTEEEKGIIGFSYGRFSKLSASAHQRSASSMAHPIDSGLVIATYLAIQFLLMHSVGLLADLVSDIDSKRLDQINRLVRSNAVARKLFFDQTSKDLEVGDYVSIMKRVARVTKVNVSQYGYKSFTILFLKEPLIPEHPEDTFIPKDVHLFFKGNTIRKRVIQLLGDEARGKVSKSKITNAMDCTAIDFWEIWKDKDKRQIILKALKG